MLVSVAFGSLTSQPLNFAYAQNCLFPRYAHSLSYATLRSRQLLYILFTPRERYILYLGLKITCDICYKAHIFINSLYKARILLVGKYLLFYGIVYRILWFRVLELNFEPFRSMSMIFKVYRYINIDN